MVALCQPCLTPPSSGQLMSHVRPVSSLFSVASQAATQVAPSLKRSESVPKWLLPTRRRNSGNARAAHVTADLLPRFCPLADMTARLCSERAALWRDHRKVKRLL